jgi:hypothetical protein
VSTIASLPFGGLAFWPNADQQMPPLLDALMWEMHADHWQNIEGEPLTTAKKQELINELIDWHRHKGTRFADAMLKLAFEQGKVTEACANTEAGRSISESTSEGDVTESRGPDPGGASCGQKRPLVVGQFWQHSTAAAELVAWNRHDAAHCH